MRTQLSPLRKGNSSPPPLFDPRLLWPNSWMDQDTTWHGGRPRPRRHGVRWGPSSPPPQKGNSSPTFRPMSIVAKWSSISAIAELLYYLAVILSGFYFIRCIELLQLVCLYVIFFLILSSLRHVVTLLSQLFSKWICYIRLSFEMIPSTTSIVTAVCRPKHTGYQ